ncbi:MAG: alpha/beta hydrolase [Gemmatimonadota bacterium]
MTPHPAADDSTTSDRARPPIGRFLTVEGRTLFYHQSGSGGPAVVVLPGAGAIALDYLNLHDRVARLTTCILYDRAGTGWSDDAALPRPLGHMTDELHALLTSAAIAPPYLLVGHSLGGALARHYAQRFPSHVFALLLVDPAHEDAPAHYPPEVRAMSEAYSDGPIPELPAEVLAVWRSAFADKFHRLPPDVLEPLLDRHLARWRTGMEEARDAEQFVYAPLRAAGATPDVPLIVLSAMGTEVSPTQFLPVELQRAVNEGKRMVHRAIAASVPRGEERVLPDAVHTWVCVDQEDEVVRAIADLLGDR